jgi:hypothetical protein
VKRSILIRTGRPSPRQGLGEGEFGAADMTGPWNDEAAFRRVNNPAFNLGAMEIPKMRNHALH